MKHSSYRSLTLARHLRSGETITIPSGRTAPSATCRQPSMPNSAIPGCNGTGRLSCFRAPRPIPLHHRADKAQMKTGLYFQLDESWGSRHKAYFSRDTQFRHAHSPQFWCLELCEPKKAHVYKLAYAMLGLIAPFGGRQGISTDYDARVPVFKVMTE